MNGKHSGVFVHVRELVLIIIQIHCIIHREALASKDLGQSMSEVISLCVKVVNLIKNCPLQSQLFSQLSNELGSEHSNLLLHTKV